MSDLITVEWLMRSTGTPERRHCHLYIHATFRHNNTDVTVKLHVWRKVFCASLTFYFHLSSPRLQKETEVSSLPVSLLTKLRHSLHLSPQLFLLSVTVIVEKTTPSTSSAKDTVKGWISSCLLLQELLQAQSGQTESHQNLGPNCGCSVSAGLAKQVWNI